MTPEEQLKYKLALIQESIALTLQSIQVRAEGTPEQKQDLNKRIDDLKEKIRRENV